MEDSSLYIVGRDVPNCSKRLVGGKAVNLWHLGKTLQGFEKASDVEVPQWFALTTEAFSLFVKVHKINCIIIIGPLHTNDSPGDYIYQCMSCHT